jgi:hypothetical protein
MEEIKIDDLQLNHTYLIGRTHVLRSITVLTITDKAYQIRWNNNQNNPITWETKYQLEFDYSVVEDISDFQTYQEPIKLKFCTKYVTCTICSGMGSVPDFNSTAGTKLCPLCQGNKTIPEVTEIQS